MYTKQNINPEEEGKKQQLIGSSQKTFLSFFPQSREPISWAFIWLNFWGKISIRYIFGFRQGWHQRFDYRRRWWLGHLHRSGGGNATTGSHWRQVLLEELSSERCRVFSPFPSRSPCFLLLCIWSYHHTTKYDFNWEKKRFYLFNCKCVFKDHFYYKNVTFGSH